MPRRRSGATAVPGPTLRQLAGDELRLHWPMGDVAPLVVDLTDDGPEASSWAALAVFAALGEELDGTGFVLAPTADVDDLIARRAWDESVPVSPDGT